MNHFYTYRWPKVLAPLSEEQIAIGDDFAKYCQEVIHSRWGLIDRFNNLYLARSMRLFRGMKTLELGAGMGDHISYEDLDLQEYWANDRRKVMVDAIKSQFPGVEVIHADCQEGFELPDSYFDRILASHMLEHLSDLPTAVRQLDRLLKDDGQLGIVLPCDPGLAYRVARLVTTERAFKKRYKQSYGWFIESEHINAPEEVLHVLLEKFRVVHQRYFPFPVPIKNINLMFGMVLEKK